MASEGYEEHVVEKCPRCNHPTYVPKSKIGSDWMCSLCTINISLGREGIDPWKEDEENQPKRPKREKKPTKKLNLR